MGLMFVGPAGWLVNLSWLNVKTQQSSCGFLSFASLGFHHKWELFLHFIEENDV